MKKWMLIKRYQNSPVEIWEFIDDIQEAKKYWYVADAIRKYGVSSVMPIVMNRNGGYHTHRPDEEDVIAIIESEYEPSISVLKQYPINNPNFKTGWLSPECTTFSCNYMGHIDLAIKIVHELLGMPESVTADDSLLERGWIKVANGKWYGYWEKINDKQAAWLEKKGFSKRI